jgi:hypothetical protein
MKLLFSLFADAAKIDPDGCISMLHGGWDVYTVTGFPFIVRQMFLVLRIEFEAAECGRIHALSISPLGPKGNLIAPVGDVQINVPKVKLRGSGKNNYTCVGDLGGVTFHEPGDYVFSFSIGKTKLGQAVLAIVHQS